MLVYLLFRENINDKIMFVVCLKTKGLKKKEKDGLFMISFVVLEKDHEMRGLLVKIVKNFLFDKDDHYRIYEYERCTKTVQEEVLHIDGPKIYLMDVDDEEVNMCEIARNVRKEGDLNSQIILITDNDKRDYIGKLHNILYLDFLRIDERIIEKVNNAIKDAYKTITRYRAYSFTAYDEIYRLNYDDIYFVTKNLRDDSVTIYTKDDSYLDFISLKGIEEKLSKDPRFLKVHRSCIINLYHISSYDKKSNTIVFNNGMKTNLIAKNSKAKLVKWIKEFENVS